MSRRAAAPTMPHMISAFLSRWFPGRDRHLPGARHGELSRRRVLADGRAGADIGAARDAHRRHQRRVRADEAVVLDHRAVLRRAVVVASDGSSTHVHAATDLGVADVREVVGLGAGAEAARLDLDEVSNMHVLRQTDAGPQPRERPDAATLAELGVVEMREREHLGAGADADVFQHAVRSDPDVVAEAYPALEHAVDVDRDVAAALERAAHVDARRVGQRHAGVEQPPRLAPLADAFQHGELLHRIDAGDFPLILGLDGDHRHRVGHGERHQVGEGILVLRIVIADLRQPWREPPRAQAEKTGIDLADGELARRGILLLDDARDALRAVAHDAAIARRVVELGDNNAYAPASALEPALQR